MKQYTDLVKRILAEGELRADRTKVGTLSVFGAGLEFDLRERFPLVTCKETRWKTAFLEMLWFLRGEGNTQYLHRHGSKLWDAWADKSGNLGPVYGVNWRRWGMETGRIDQVWGLIRGLRADPHGRRHMVSAWNVADLQGMALPPCHWAHQCYVSNEGELDLKLFMRSSDVALGLPFNIAQYALLTHLYARATGLTARRLLVDLGDAHIYSNHVDAMREVADLGPVADHTTLIFNTDNHHIDGYAPGDFAIEGYTPRTFVPLPVAV